MPDNLTAQQSSLLQELQIDPNSDNLKTRIKTKIQELSSKNKPDEIRTVLKLPINLAPYKLAILPLMKKDGLAQKALEIYQDLRKKGISCDYDEAGSVGKRYRRQDENGTPFCITVDYQSKEDGTVTIRNRDTMEQQRIGLDEITAFLIQQGLQIV